MYLFQKEHFRSEMGSNDTVVDDRISVNGCISPLARNLKSRQQIGTYFFHAFISNFLLESLSQPPTGNKLNILAANIALKLRFMLKSRPYKHAMANQWGWTWREQIRSKLLGCSAAWVNFFQRIYIKTYLHNWIILTQIMFKCYSSN